MNQRQPRVEDEAWLAEVRKMPCLICQRPGPSDPAHLRSAARQYGKRQTGLGEKPDDKWVLPLCRNDHEGQHRHNELQWWASKGIADPFAIAMALYANRTSKPRQTRPRKVAVKAREPRGERAKIFTRKTEWPRREMQSRSTFTTKGTK